MSRRILYDHLVWAVPNAIMRAGIKSNACILSTRLGVEALRASGVRARPLPVKLAVMNPTYRAFIKAADQAPSAKQAAADGAWVVTLGHPVDAEHPAAVVATGGWDGHLVVLAEERYLLDLSAGQVKRMAKDIHAEAFWVEARPLARGQGVALEADDGCAWLYEPDPGNQGFLRAPAWAGYRVTVRGRRVISERSGPRADVPVAPRVELALP